MKPTGTVTFLFADIVSASLGNRRSPDSPITVARFGSAINEVVARNHGLVYRTSGYRYCCAFVLPLDAVVAANQIQNRLGVGNCVDIGPVVFRMAVHTGEAKESDGNYSGVTITRVLQLLSMAHPGEILVSNSVETLTTEFLPEDLHFEEVPNPRETPRRERVLQLRNQTVEKHYAGPPLHASRYATGHGRFKVAFRQPRTNLVFAR